jgi:hypothetical protein
MTNKVKRYRVAEGRTVIPPSGLVRAPDGSNARLVGGGSLEVDLSHPESATLSRYVRARVRAGDLVEVESVDMPTTADAPGPRPIATRKDGDK